MNLRMQAFSVIGLMALSMPFALQAKSEFEALDERIVQAYNTPTKRGVEIYSLCQEMVDLCQDKRNDKSDVWLDKARRLMTLACFYEAAAAWQRNDFKQVYVWCVRASSSGASQGVIGGFDLGEVSNLLIAWQINAKKAMDASGESYSNLSASFRPVSRADARRELAAGSPPSAFPEGGDAIEVKDAGIGKQPTGVSGRLREGAGKGIAVLSRAKHDSDGELFVVIKTPAGREVKIVYVKDKGWADSSQPVPLCYESWTKCAEEIVRNESK